MNPLNNLTVRDKQALILYLGIALLCAAFFAAGIFVGRSAGPPTAAAGLAPAAGFAVHVLGLGSAEEAERLSATLRAEGHKLATVEAASKVQGYAVKVGPLLTRAAADDLTLKLRNAGYSTVKVVRVAAETQDR